MRRNYLTKAIICGFILAVLFSFVGFNGICENVEDKVLRLHIRANSNSNEDQQIKIAVKDKIFTVANDIAAGCSSYEEAESAISDNLDIIASAANSCLQELGVEYGAVAYIDDSFFATRNYGDFTLPAGRYHALRIDLGEAEGENWWCAVYPALCTSSSVKYDSFTDTEKRLIAGSEGNFEIRFRIYEIYRRLADVFSK